MLRSLVRSQPGEPLTEEKVGADLRRIFGRGGFEGISYHIVGDAGPRAMVIEPREKSWGPNFLRFGLGLASDFSGENQFNALVQYRKTWLNRLGGEWLTELQVGQNTFIHSEFYQPVNEAGQWFVAPYFTVGQLTRGVFIDDDKVADYKVRLAQGGVDAGAVLGTWGQFRVGPVWTRVDANVDTGSPVLPSVKENTAGLRAVLFVDQTDNAFFAREGFGMSASAYAAMESFGSARDYQRVEALFRGAKSWGPHTLNVSVSGGTDLGSDMPPYEAFMLGGPLRLSALPRRPVHRARVRVRPAHVLQPHPAAAGPPGQRRLRRRLARGRPHPRPLRRSPVAGHAVVRIRVPRRGHVRRSRLPGGRRGRVRQLVGVPAARGAIGAWGRRRVQVRGQGRDPQRTRGQRRVPRGGRRRTIGSRRGAPRAAHLPTLSTTPCQSDCRSPLAASPSAPADVFTVTSLRAGSTNTFCPRNSHSANWHSRPDDTIHVWSNGRSRPDDTIHVWSNGRSRPDDTIHVWQPYP